MNHMEPLMKSLYRAVLVGLSIPASTALLAQVSVSASPSQELLLSSGDAKAVANKRLVYDFWREVFEGGHMELAEKYMTPSYVQHNPNVPTGRAGFVEFFGRYVRPKKIEPTIKAPVVAIVAEGDLVVLAFAREGKDPKDPTKTYTTTWFDMFRIVDGKVAEHWDPATKQ